MNLDTLLATLDEKRVQIWLHDGQLQFSAPKGVLQGALREAVITQKLQLIAHLAAQMKKPIICPASPLQKALWIDCALEAQSADLYIEAKCLRVSGTLDLTVLKAAVSDLCRKHGALRTRFMMVDGNLMQVIDQAHCMQVTVQPLPSWDEDTLAAEAKHLAYAPFDLLDGDLSRITVLEGPDANFALVFSQHHLITDRWSIGVLFRDLSQFYAQRRADQTPSFPPQIQTYATYVQQIEQARGLAQHQIALKALVDGLEGKPTQLDLPYARVPQRGYDLEGGQVVTTCPAQMFLAVTAFCSKQSVTPFAYLATVFGLLLSRYTDQSQIVISIPNSARPDAALEDVAGMFVNTLPLGLSFEPDQSVAETLQSVQARTLDLMDADTLTLADVLAVMDIDRSGAVPPLCQAMLVFQNMEMHDLALDTLALDDLAIQPNTAKMPLSLTVLPSNDGVNFVWDYQVALFEKSTIERMAANFMALLGICLSDVDKQIGTLPCLAVDEAQMLMNASRPSASDYPRDASIPEAFAQRAQIYPTNVALESADGRLTYQELHDRAARYAAYLVRNGARPGDRIGICLGRGFDLYVATLGILQAGCAYVPLDLSYPESRLRVMVDQAQPKLVIAQEVLGWFEGQRLAPPSIAALPDQPIAVRSTAMDAAYVMFTSGTTGTPKAVVVPHRAVLRLVKGSEFIAFGPDLCMLQLAPFAFDAATLELWGPLLNGGRVVIAPEGLQDPADIGTLVTTWGITALWLPAGLFSLMVDAACDALCHLDYVIAGGDTLSQRAVQKALAAFTTTKLINGYGPTENTTFTTTHTFQTGSNDPVLIGRPIGATECHILNDAGLPVPIGAKGMLYTGGDGLAQGYLGDETATNAKFRDHTVVYGETHWQCRLYNTGDLARWVVSDSDGGLAIALVGRADTQVKVAGHRIELSEIESHLNNLDFVEQALVLYTAPEDGAIAEQSTLVAFVQSVGPCTDDKIRDAMSVRLPPYMLPHKIVLLDTWPLTRNGKLDRRALIGMSHNVVRDEAQASAGFQTDLEKSVAQIWSNLLGTQITSRDDHFFHSGGHSLLAMRMVFAVQAIPQAGEHIALRQIFDNPTLAGFCNSLTGQSVATPILPPLSQIADQGVWPLSLSQQRLWSLHQMLPLGASYNVPGVFRLTGPLDTGRLQDALAQVLARHPALRTQFVATPTGAVQHVLPPANIDLTPQIVPFDQLEAAVKTFVTAELAIEEGQVFAAALLRCGEDDHVLCVMAHHLVCDGLSVNVLVQDLADIYAQTTLPVLPRSYGDYAVWQSDHYYPARRPVLEGYWTDRLASLPDLELATDFIRPDNMNLSGDAIPFFFPAKDVMELCKKLDTTLFTLVSAAFSVLLYRMSGQTDFAIGTPIAGRPDAQLSGLVGFFNETLVMRTKIEPDQSFADYVALKRNEILEDMAHQDMPFATLVDLLNPPRRLNRTPLFQAMVSVNEGLESNLLLDGLSVERLGVVTDTAKYELLLEVSTDTNISGEKQITGALNFQTSLFQSGTAQHIVAQFEELIASVCADPNQQLETVRFDQIGSLDLSISHGPSNPHWREGGLLAAAIAQAAETPYHIATIDSADGTSSSYAEMFDKVGRLAAALSKAGVGPQDFVVAHLGRHSDILVSLLAIWWIGAVYVPVRPGLPMARKQQLLAQLKQPVVISHGPVAELQARAWVDPQNLVDATPPPVYAPDPQHPAYMLFTSGSTGTPKGAIVQHLAIMNHACWVTNAFDVTAADRFIMSTAPDFDVSMLELTSQLLTGASVVFPHVDRNDLVGLMHVLGAYEVTIVCFVPSILQTLVGDDLLKGQSEKLRLIFSGGEAAQLSLFNNLQNRLPQAEIANIYGPAECCIDVLHYRHDPNATLPYMVLDHTIDNTDIVLLDPAGQIVPAGQVGEIAILGAHVGLGYLDDPDKTAASFVSGNQGQRTYLTGDLGRFGYYGLQYLGRKDRQMKVRGQRIEAGEIEAIANACDSVTSSAAMIIDGNLVVAVESKTDCAAQVSIRMKRETAIQPSRIVVLDSFPRGSSLKIDLRTLKHQIAQMKPDQDSHPREAAKEVTPLEQVVIDQTEAVLTRYLGETQSLNPDTNFFDAGGSSLSAVSLAVRLKEAFGIAVTVADVFQAATLGDLANGLEHGGATREVGDVSQAQIVPIGEDAPARAPATFAQRSLWFLDQMEGGGAAYTTIHGFHIDGKLNPDALQYACDQILARHTPLRTRFLRDESEVLQIIDQPGVFPVSRDLDTVDCNDHAAIVALIQSELDQGFDLAHEWPVRLRLVPTDQGGFVCILALHHIATDGWSAGVFLSELAQYYEDFASPRPSVMPPMSYVDYAQKQHKDLQSAQFAECLQEVAKGISDAPQRIDLPLDFDRPAQISFKGLTAVSNIPKTFANEIRAFAKRTNTSVFMAGLAAFMSALHRWSMQDDLLVGVPVANREGEGEQALIGLFANSMVLRAEFAPETTFREVLELIRARTLTALGHQNVPFEKLVDVLQVARDTGASPVFQVMFNHQNTPSRGLRMGDAQLDPIPFDTGTAKYDILATLLDQPDGSIDLHWEYRADLFVPATAARMSQQFVALLKAGVAEPDTRVKNLNLNTVNGKVSMMTGATDPQPDPLFVQDMVVAQARAFPYAIAASAEGETLTYQALHDWSDTIAARLQAQGVGPGDRVGMSLPRGFAMIAGVLGILKTGAALVALDQNMPLARQSLIGEQARLAACLVQTNDTNSTGVELGCPLVEVCNMHELDGSFIPPFKRTPADPAYVLFTSGSTGVPKGVVYPHRGLSNLISFQLREPYFQHKARCLQYTAIGFDVAIQEILATLASGGQLVLITEGLRQDMPGLLQHIVEMEVEQLFVPFAALQQLAVAYGKKPQPLALKAVMTAGERLHITADLRAMFVGLPEATLVNQYGPTETHVVSRLVLSHDPSCWPEFPGIGAPISNTSLTLTSPDGSPTAIGVPGEICVRGDAVALGYLDANEGSVGGFRNVAYYTGDLGVMWPDEAGELTLKYLGRQDQQVKIRGYRVNIEEIENALCNLPQVSQCVIVPLLDEIGKPKALVAHMVASQGDLDSDALRQGLKKILPDYMVPSYWMQHARLDVSPNGKLVRKGLPAPTDDDFAAPKRSSTGPDDVIEERVLDVWSRLLDRNDLSTTDNFFDVGGSSILLLQLHAELLRLSDREEQFKVVQLFEYPTIQMQAKLVRGEAARAIATRSAGRAAAQKTRRKRKPISSQ